MDLHKNRRRHATEAFRTQRQNSRETHRNQRRPGLDELHDAAPVVAESKENAIPASQKLTKAVQLRRQQLEQWRKERDAKRLAEQRTLKPVFRCGRTTAAGVQPCALPPVKDSKPVKGFQHVSARINTGLKSLAPNIQFAPTSKNPMIFTGTDKYLTSDEDADPKEKPEEKEKVNRRPAFNKSVKSGAVTSANRGSQESNTASRNAKQMNPSQKVRQRSGISKAVKRPPSSKSQRALMRKTEAVEENCVLQSTKEDLKSPEGIVGISAKASTFVSPIEARLERSIRTPTTMRKTPVKNLTSLVSTPQEQIMNEKISTPTSVAMMTSSTRKTPASRKKKRVPPEEEDLVTDDDSFSLGCTPSGKVRRIDNGKPLPVIRKSHELLRLKATDRVAALLQSPMVEFRKRRSGVTIDPSSPFGQLALSEEEQLRRDERLEMRAEVLQQVAENYAKSPEAQMVTESPLKHLNPSSARKVRRKSRLLQEAFACTAEKTGQPMAALSAQHFRRLLSDETTRLEELRAYWEPLSFEVNFPSNAQAEIAAVIGQTELLFRHKFFFYEKMITKHESGVSGGQGALEGRLVTAEDLLGYWELMHLEIDNLDARYACLKQWEAKGWSGSLADLDNTAAPVQPAKRSPRKKIVKAKRVVKKPVTSKFAAFRAQMKKKTREEETDTAESEGLPSSGERIGTKDGPLTTPPVPESSSGVPLRSALKSGRRQPPRSSVAAVRFAPSTSLDEEEEGHRVSDDQCTPPTKPMRARRQLTPYKERQVTVGPRRSAVTASATTTSSSTFVSPQRPLRSRTRSFSLHKMPASPRATTPTSASGEVSGRPKTGTPFPEARSNSGSRRRIAELRSNAGLSLRTEEARRQSSSLSPPSRRAGGRTRQSSVRFNDAEDDSPETEDGHIIMPMTPYNRNSLVPMARRSRASSAPRSKSKGSSASSSTSSSASTSASRVRFDSDTYSPPADHPSAPVTPFSKDSLVPLPRRHRQSNSTSASAPKRSEADGATFTETVTPPLTPRLVDVTPLRRSSRRRTKTADTPAGDVSLL